MCPLTNARGTRGTFGGTASSASSFVENPLQFSVYKLPGCCWRNPTGTGEACPIERVIRFIDQMAQYDFEVEPTNETMPVPILPRLSPHRRQILDFDGRTSPSAGPRVALQSCRV